MYYEFKNITLLEIEPTTFCNAFCGDCARNVNGGELAPKFTPSHMTMDTWKSIITPKNLQWIQHINFNGNLGDCTMHPDFLEFLEYLYSVNQRISVSMSTNGGTRTPEWWKSLAEILSKFKNHQVNFSVDGDETTNHIYRRGVSWDKLVKNIKSFNSAGGQSRWWCVVFDHNKDQLDRLVDLAMEFGCESFLARRDHSPENSIYMKAYKKFPETTITSPKTFEIHEKYQNVPDIESRLQDNLWSGKYRPPLELDKRINCDWGYNGMVSIDNKGNVWPCCFINVKSFSQYIYKEEPIKKYWDFNNLNVNSLKFILDKISEDLNTSWNTTMYKRCNVCNMSQNSNIRI